MSAIYTPPVSAIKRYTRQGLALSPQGADGLALSMREAAAGLAGAEWQLSESAPSIPVHDYDGPVPSGDAYRATYGYDADARTERYAAGAVAYMIPLPADARTGAPCSVESIAVEIVGDRYLGDVDNAVEPYLSGGAIVTAHLCATDAPPSWEEVLAAEGATVCRVTSMAMRANAKGVLELVAIPPNDREGVVETATLALSGAAPAYLCVVVRVADYLVRRGTWYEGGAMVRRGNIAVTLSRAVVADPEGVALDFEWPRKGSRGDGAYASTAGCIYSSIAWPQPGCDHDGARSPYSSAYEPWIGQPAYLRMLTRLQATEGLSLGTPAGMGLVGYPYGHAAISHGAADVYGADISTDTEMRAGYRLSAVPSSSPVKKLPRMYSSVIGYPVSFPVPRSVSRILIPSVSAPAGVIYRLTVYLGGVPPFFAPFVADGLSVGGYYDAIQRAAAINVIKTDLPALCVSGRARALGLLVSVDGGDVGDTPYVDSQGSHIGPSGVAQLPIRRISRADLSATSGALEIPLDADVVIADPSTIIVALSVVDLSSDGAAVDPSADRLVSIPVQGWRID